MTEQILRSENGVSVSAHCGDELCVRSAAFALEPHHFSVSDADAVTAVSHRYSIVGGPEVWCDSHDSAYPCTVTDESE